MLVGAASSRHSIDIESELHIVRGAKFTHTIADIQTPSFHWETKYHTTGVYFMENAGSAVLRLPGMVSQHSAGNGSDSVAYIRAVADSIFQTSESQDLRHAFSQLASISTNKNILVSSLLYW
jgi:ribosome-interacting GTPase 1